LNRNYFKLITFKILNIQIKNQPNLNSDFNLHQFINFIKNDLTPKFQIKILELNRFSSSALTESLWKSNWNKLRIKPKRRKHCSKPAENIQLNSPQLQTPKCNTEKSNYNNCFCCKPHCVRLIRWSYDGSISLYLALILLLAQEAPSLKWKSWRARIEK